MNPQMNKICDKLSYEGRWGTREIESSIPSSYIIRNVFDLYIELTNLMNSVEYKGMNLTQYHSMQFLAKLEIDGNKEMTIRTNKITT
jgi:hypothetical protein